VLPNDLQALVTSGHVVFDTTKHPAEVTVKKDFPLEKIGTFTITSEPYSRGLQTLLTDKRFTLTTTLVIHHPCAKAVMSVKESPKAAEFIIGKTEEPLLTTIHKPHTPKPDICA
jgi:hypothetical protein